MKRGSPVVPPTRRPIRAILVLLGVSVLCVQGYEMRQIWRAVGETFPGFIVTRDLVVTQLNQPYWSGVRAGLRPGDLVLAVEGRSLRSARELIRDVKRHPADTVLRYSLFRNGEMLELAIPTSIFRAEDFYFTFGVLGLTAVAYLLVGSAVAWFRGDTLGAGTYAFSFAIAFTMGVSTDISWTREFPLSRLSDWLLVASIIHFALVFPAARPVVRRHPWIVVTVYVAMAPLAFAGLWLSADSAAVAGIEWLNRWLTFGASVGFLASMVFGAWTTVPVDAAARTRRLPRDRARIALRGLLLSVGGYAIGFLGAEFGFLPSAPSSVFVVPAWIWLGALVLASLRDDVFDLGGRLREALARPAVYGLVGVGYALLLFAVALIVARASGPSGWSFAFAVLAIAVILVEPLRRLAQSIVVWSTDVPIVVTPRSLRDLSEELASTLDHDAIVATVAAMADRLGVPSIRLFLVDHDGCIEASGPVRLAVDDPLVSGLAQHREGISLVPSTGSGRGTREGRRETLETLGIDFAFPLLVRDQFLGFLGVAVGRDGSIASDDRTGFTTLAGHIAAALENARVFGRIRELEEELRAENVVLKEELSNVPVEDGLVGRSAPMQRVYRWIERVAPTEATVLLRGETGTGKELIARAIHARSLRRHHPMIRVNCAAIHASLLESEFFGHERGAFTAAVVRKIGRLELAAGGTVFLDEIGDLPLELQPKLLRVLQEREFERVGGGSPIRADVRVIAATNRDLDALVARGRFRPDLLFRLDVLSMTVPPLRDRREDIPLLVAHLIRRYAAKMQKPVTGIEERSLRSLLSYQWPGNVRELENVVERAMILSTGERLVVRELESATLGAVTRSSLRPLSEILRDVKMHSIRRALSATEGNQARAAELLRLKPSSLSRMMKALGMRR